MFKKIEPEGRICHANKFILTKKKFLDNNDSSILTSPAFIWNWNHEQCRSLDSALVATFLRVYDLRYKIKKMVQAIHDNYALDNDQFITFYSKVWLRSYYVGGLISYDSSKLLSTSITRFFTRLVLFANRHHSNYGKYELFKTYNINNQLEPGTEEASLNSLHIQHEKKLQQDRQNFFYPKLSKISDKEIDLETIVSFVLIDDQDFSEVILNELVSIDKSGKLNFKESLIKQPIARIVHKKMKNSVSFKSTNTNLYYT